MNNQILILAELQEKLLDKYKKVNNPEMQICIKMLNKIIKNSDFIESQQ